VSLLVSIHDVTPALADGVMRLWSLCAERGVRPALFVVPNWHGAWPLDAHPVFVAWLRARADDGAEIVLHGDRHDEAGLPRGLGDRLRAWGRTAGEGEFLTLRRDEAAARIARGLARLRTVGLDPVGFVPPAWLARPEGHDAAGDAGLVFTEDDRAIHLYPSRRRVASPVVRWSARTSVRAVGSVAVARARLALQSGAAYPRVAFHPQDLAHPVTARALGPTLDRWLARHPPVAYRALSP
jgi:predicted deacetylase